MELFNIFRAFWNWWDQYYLEAACHGVLNIWQEEHPEYLDRIRQWIETGEIPDDHDLQILCRVYQKRILPRPCYYRAKT